MNFRNFWSSDLRSSMVVFLVALPLCLGIALASGAPLFSGLLAGIIGGIVVGSLSGSSVSVSGPAAGLTTIVAAAILNLGSFEAFLLSVALAGLIQLILGFARAGAIGHFFPISVIKGMLAAIGLILILKQIPHAVGFDADFEGDQNFLQPDGQNTFSEIFTAWDFLSPGALVISAISILLLILWEGNGLQRFKFFRLVPSALIVVLIGILLNSLFTITLPYFAIETKHLVSIPTFSQTKGITSLLTFPDFSLWRNPQIYITAATIAIVASLETLLSIEACDRMDKRHRITPLNQELKAQGIGNFISGMLGGLPVTSVIVRSSANINAGARSKASAISHGVILILSVLLLPGLLTLIPLASLAGILIMVGYKLTKPILYKEMYRKGMAQFVPFAITIFAVVFTDLLQGVFLGVLVAIFFILKTNFKRAVILVSTEKNYLIRFTKDVSFLHKNSLRQAFEAIPEDTKLLVDGSSAQFMDQDIKEMLVDFTLTAKTKNIEVELKNINIEYEKV
ncbi:MAG: SulP family inorganic anion transporter [Cyclobacteriaceae bacterium]|nr:SulP family inorganic anion transporter [Cyclobacteriaceae bacterium]